MPRNPNEFVDDVLGCVAKIRQYTRRGKASFLRSSMARDAVVARLVQLGEAVKGARAAGLDLESLAPEVPWRHVSGMRDVLAHHYWQTDPEIVWAVVAKDLKPLEAAARRIQRKLRRA